MHEHVMAMYWTDAAIVNNKAILAWCVDRAPTKETKILVNIISLLKVGLEDLSHHAA